MRFVVGTYSTGAAVFSSTFANANVAQHLTLPGRHRLADDRSMLELDGRRLAASSSLFNPTWQGVEEWLNFGLFNEGERGYRPIGLATAAPSSAPAPAPRASGLAVIATVHALRSQDYVVTRSAPETCAGDGASGDHLHVTARDDAADHPLTDVVVDPSGRVCALRFTLAGHSGYAIRGDFELDFGEVGTYWLVERGAVDYDVRSLNLGHVRAHLTFAYSDVAFPATLPDADFDV